MNAEAPNGRKGVVFKLDLGYFCVDPEDRIVSWHLVNEGAYGMREIKLAFSHMEESARVLVVGAHIGTAAIPLSRTCRELVAIEANPATFELLRLNVLMNERRNITAIHAAANDRNGSLEFVMNTQNSGGSKRMPKFRDVIYFYDSRRSRPFRRSASTTSSTARSISCSWTSRARSISPSWGCSGSSPRPAPRSSNSCRTTSQGSPASRSMTSSRRSRPTS